MQIKYTLQLFERSINLVETVLCFSTGWWAAAGRCKCVHRCTYVISRLRIGYIDFANPIPNKLRISLLMGLAIRES